MSTLNGNLEDLKNLNFKIKKAKEYGYSAFLLLKSKEIFFGYSLGAVASIAAELCFTTAMTGYQHTITDPSFAEQIILFTQPHIGNIGINKLDNESSKIFCKGIVLRENIVQSKHYLIESSFTDWLKENKIAAICGIDTRQLTKILHNLNSEQQLTTEASALLCTNFREDNFQLEESLLLLNNCRSMQNMELTSIAAGFSFPPNAKAEPKDSRPLVALLDFGTKYGIIENLNKYFEVKIIPAKIDFYKEILALKPAAIVLSNGPGDPHATYDLFKEDFTLLLTSGLPILGICLGHQLLALSFNLRTEKMSTGHRGSNHPIYNLTNGKVEITSQNHGFMVVNNNDSSNNININQEENEVNKKPNSYHIAYIDHTDHIALVKNEEINKEKLIVTHISLFDGSIEGFKKGNKIFAYQYHPEGSPGPSDAHYIFKEFFYAVVAL